MLEPISIGIIGAVVGYLSGHLHARVSGSSCLYGCCKFDELDTDFSLMKDEQNEPKTAFDGLLVKKNNNK